MSYEIKNAWEAFNWLVQPGIQTSAFGDETTKEAVNCLLLHMVYLYEKYEKKRKVDK